MADAHKLFFSAAFLGTLMVNLKQRTLDSLYEKPDCCAKYSTARYYKKRNRKALEDADANLISSYTPFWHKRSPAFGY